MKYVVTLNGKSYEVEVEETEAVITSVTDAAQASVPSVPRVPSAPSPAASPASAAPSDTGGAAKIVAPMPGTVLSVRKAAGDSVERGETVLILEAMKMENEIVSPVSGVIKRLLVQKGSSVETDAVLAEVG